MKFIYLCNRPALKCVCLVSSQ